MHPRPIPPPAGYQYRVSVYGQADLHVEEAREGWASSAARVQVADVGAKRHNLVPLIFGVDGV